MSDQLTAFQEAAKTDTALQEKLKAAGNPDTVVAIALEAGFTFSSEDLLNAAEADDLELELWQLEAISGGKGKPNPTHGMSTPVRAGIWSEEPPDNIR
jgi:predicted ribosomally synthesized peptide with nif11-like leader